MLSIGFSKSGALLKLKAPEALIENRFPSLPLSEKDKLSFSASLALTVKTAVSFSTTAHEVINVLIIGAVFDELPPPPPQAESSKGKNK